MTDNTTDTAKEADPAETTTEQPIIDDTIITAGSLSRGLKKCREEADMDVKQAADEMRLPLAVLKALEAENFTDLPEPPYIRGYLRSYSRLNDSDPNDLIRRYEVLRGADPDDVASFTPSMPLNRVTNKSTVSPSTVKLAGLALIVLLLGVLSMIPAVSQWATDTWQSFSQKTAGSQTGSEIQTTEQAGNTTSTTANASDSNTTSMASSNNDTTANTGDSEQLALNNQGDGVSGTATAEQNQSSTSDAVTTDDANPEKAPDAATETGTGEKITDTAGTADTDKPVEADNKQTTETAAKEAEAAAKLAEETKAAEDAKKLAEQKQQEEAEAAAKLAEETKAAEDAKKLAAAEAAKQNQTQTDDNFQQPIDGTVVIRLDFTESVWMSIKNGKGQSIFSALNAPGTRKELKARTPLSFKVGNAPGVKIYLNGQLVDQAPYSHGSVAKFTVK